MKASEFLRLGMADMEKKAALRDAPEGERSMAAAVQAFWSLRGAQILKRGRMTETDGWDFMDVLKMSRSGQGDYHADDYVDRASYAGLAGESAAREAEKEAGK